MAQPTSAHLPWRGVLNLALLACGLFQSLVIGDISGSRKLK